jgi:hypothetical protein
MGSPFLSAAPYRLVAAARGTSRHDGRALRIVAAAAARSAACEREFGAGGTWKSMTPLTPLTLLRFFREGRTGSPQNDAPPPLKLWRTGDWRR